MQTCFIDNISLSMGRDPNPDMHLSNGLLECRKYRSAVVLPGLHDWWAGGVVEEKGQLLGNTAVHSGTGKQYHVTDEDIIQSNKSALFLGHFVPTWGHCITDGLKHFWFCFTEEYTKLVASEDIELIYVAPASYSLDGNFNELLTLLGINTSTLKKCCSPTRYQNVYIPDECFFLKDLSRYYTTEYVQLVERIRASVDLEESGYDRVYLSRSKLVDPRDFGEFEIEGVFRSLGFHVVYPETLSARQQIAILKKCEILCAFEGSIMHNSLFCASGISVVVLKKAFHLSSYTYAISAMKSFNVTYVDAHLSCLANPGGPWGGPFFMCLSPCLCKCLHEIWGVSVKPVISIPRFLRYMKESMRCGNRLGRCRVFCAYKRRVFLEVIRSVSCFHRSPK